MATKIKPRRVRTKFLEERGWSRDLRRRHLQDVTAGGYSLDEVEQAEQTTIWKRDAQRAANGLPVLLSRQDLKERGWTPTMVKQLLGEPPIVTPLNSSGSRVLHLFVAEVVENIEDSQNFQERLQAAAQRSKRGRNIAAGRSEEIKRTVSLWADNLEVSPPDSLATLQKLAREHQEAFYRQRGEVEIDTTSADATTLDRWCLNYLRHQCSQYDQLLNEATVRFAGEPGVRDLYDEIVRPRIDTLTTQALNRLRNQEGVR